MNITEICIRRPVLAWMIMSATVVFGAVAISRIGISQFPDVDHPTVSVALAWEGAAPEAMETDVVEVVEESMTQVEGVRSISSSSTPGNATVTLELELSRDVDVAVQDIQTRLSQAQRKLPRDMEPPVIRKSNPDDNPIMWIGLSGPFSPQLLADTVRYTLKEKLQAIPGVGEALTGGLPERNVRVWVDAVRLDERGVTVEEVVSALSRQHVELPAGRIDAEGREISVRVMGEALDLREMRELVIRDSGGAPIRLQDVAIVEDGFEDVRRITRFNGSPAQGIAIRKQRGANAVAVARTVRATLDEIRKTLPAGMDLGINFDSTIYVEESVDELQFELLLAVGLTALVCWIFLGSLSATVNVVLAIPMSLLGTVAFIYFAGFTLNTFTLLALALAVGIVVDDAIMVLENIHRHHALGKSGRIAAAEGTQEIKFAAMSATLAVVAIFLPVVFMEGVVGRFFLEFGVTFCVAVLLSYVEAVTLAPARAAQLLSSMKHGETRRGLGRVAELGFDWLSRLYGRVLQLGLRRPLVVLGLAAGVLAAAWHASKTVRSEFVPSQDMGRLVIRLQSESGSDLKETDRLVSRAEKFVMSRPEVARVFLVVGAFHGDAVNAANMFVTLAPRGKRMSSQALANLIRKEINSYPGLHAFISDGSSSGFSGRRGFPVELSVRGPDFKRLIQVSEEMKRKMLASGSVVDLDSDFRPGMPELRITPDRARASDLGVSVQEVATTINALVGGVRAGKYSTRGRRIDVRVRLMADQRARPEDIGRLKLRTRSGALVPLSQLASQQEVSVLQAVTRMDRERSIMLYGNVGPGSTQAEALATAARLTRDLPAGYRVLPGGASRTFGESMSTLFFALGLGVIVAYMILASQFNSLIHPVTVLSILPLSMAGAVFSFVLAGITLNVFSMIGLLLLMGIVKKNSIILVDYANQVRAEGTGQGVTVSPAEAMRRAGPIRLRPILMTAAATIMAAVPAAMGIGPGSEIRVPMAVAVIGGMVLSTALSLLVVPAFYVVIDRFRRRGATPSSEQEP